MGIVDDLLAQPGLYIGLGLDPQGNHGAAAARLVVTPLPGGAGVSLDYETFNPAGGDRVRGHAEHTIVGRTHDGGAVLVTGHVHGDSVAVMHETSPGVFELGPEGSPFPMKIVLSVPEPGRIRHAWWYGMPGDELVERDVADVQRID